VQRTPFKKRPHGWPCLTTANGDLDPQAVAELRRLARSRPRSGREAVAYPHEPGDPFYELDWVFLHEHPAILQRHWELAWREGRV
jgi:hypothetical protein